MTSKQRKRMVLTRRKLMVRFSYCVYAIIILLLYRNVGFNFICKKPMFHFSSPWKRLKTRGILTFSGGIEMAHWLEGTRNPINLLYLKVHLIKFTVRACKGFRIQLSCGHRKFWSYKRLADSAGVPLINVQFNVGSFR